MYMIRLNSEQVAEVLKEYVAEEKTIAQIAEEYGVKPVTIHRWARAAGVTGRIGGKEPRDWQEIRKQLVEKLGG